MCADDLINKRLINCWLRKIKDVYPEEKKDSILTIVHDVLGCHRVCVHHQVRQLSTELHGFPPSTQPVKYTRDSWYFRPEKSVGLYLLYLSYLLLMEPGLESSVFPSSILFPLKNPTCVVNSQLIQNQSHIQLSLWAPQHWALYLMIQLSRYIQLKQPRWWGWRGPGV